MMATNHCHQSLFNAKDLQQLIKALSGIVN